MNILKSLVTRTAIAVVAPLTLSFATIALAESPFTLTPRGYVVYRAAAAPKIDGKLSDDEWGKVPWSEPFVDIEGADHPAPTHQTRMKMTWDDEALYIAAELVEPNVWGTLTEHDSVIFYDPDFEVFIDPDGDNHMYAELELNALNTTWDLLLNKPYKDGGKAVNGWEIMGLKTAVAINGTINDPSDVDQGWTVEISWPWKGLQELSTAKFPPQDGDRLRIDFSRVEWDVVTKAGKTEKVPNRPEHNWVWSPQGVINMHRPETWGEALFSTQNVGAVTFKQDPARPYKTLLHNVYYAQKAYHEQHDAYAADLSQLDLHVDGLKQVTLHATPHAFTASIKTPESAGGKSWVIDQDSLLLTPEPRR
ncbi:carbohydrate-binding family 9-like protein [Blastopirellula sp. JC732]|uniref:Carbohydrate-binding family 9-like protein n=1 Tax=Blastopirellula sediminis TaxID=2894196 RepID=A0A9X1MQI2_9BACT|nr:carbohydrate-binding family 9-like protein [Blastopirellula sediminis]MCC9606956.1 carbohydrate-binding family 9-like protein [Blastopirellula sediminis]MCC9629749.1 carbohydrate-binding family 9-like protein [Blastopirellula sediminis]